MTDEGDNYTFISELYCIRYAGVLDDLLVHGPGFDKRCVSNCTLAHFESHIINTMKLSALKVPGSNSSTKKYTVEWTYMLTQPCWLIVTIAALQ